MDFIFSVLNFLNSDQAAQFFVLLSHLQYNSNTSSVTNNRLNLELAFFAHLTFFFSLQLLVGFFFFSFCQVTRKCDFACFTLNSLLFHCFFFFIHFISTEFPIFR